MDPAKMELEHRRIFEVFNKKRINQFQLEAVYPEITPVFIVGMARSGTSLVEQILLSHSKVSTVGEGQSMEAIINGFPRKFDRFNDRLASIDCLKNETLITAASRYLQGLKQRVSEDRPFIINKTPANFKYIGLIKMMFPNAKIIHMQRHPGDNCVSCFLTNFSIGNNYAFDAHYLGYFYRKYHELMTHWHEVLDDDFIFDLPYEDIVNHPEKKIRELLAFCGLDWEPVCLEHEKLEGYIATSSVMQANRPIYKSSIGRWEHYRPWLESLLNIDDLIENYKY